jgi:hypothetical protein
MSIVITAAHTPRANVEVITTEHVAKMPDKNLADSLQRLAGVDVRTDYDEAEKVSMRGTNPDMSLILFNGHTVSGGDWYVSDQGSSITPGLQLPRPVRQQEHRAIADVKQRRLERDQWCGNADGAT